MFTPIHLDKIDSDKIVYECSKAHVCSVLDNQKELLRLAKSLAKEVDTLNPKAGVLGEGKCVTMQAIARSLLENLL